MKFAPLLALLSLLAGFLLSSCGSRGGLAAEEEAVSPEAHEMKQLRRAELENREQERGWR